MSKKKVCKISKFKIIVIIIAIIFFLISLITIPFYKKIYLNIYVAGTYVGNLDKDQATQKLSSIELPKDISLKVGDDIDTISTSEIVLGIDTEKSIDRAFNYANSGNILLDIYTKSKLIFYPVNLPLELNFDDQKLTEVLAIAVSKSEIKPIYPSASISNSQVIIEKGKNGLTAKSSQSILELKNNLIYLKDDIVEIDFEETNDELNEQEIAVYKNFGQKVVNSKLELKFEGETITLSDQDLIHFVNFNGQFNEQKIKDKILTISRKINRNPQNSVFIVKSGQTVEFTPSIDGVTVDEDKLTDSIKTSLQEIINGNIQVTAIEIPAIKRPAKIRNEDVNNLGINTLLGKGLSYYKGSIPNRIFNIELAQSKFKGILVEPGEVFSFNNVIGDISALTGYKSAYVIKDGKTVLGDGGGVCQVSTTLFRAILAAGLPITERRAHSYRVGYYEQGFAPGLDATIFYPTTDLKFKNDTNAYLLIQPTMNKSDNSLTFEIYGTSDGRISNVSKPIITSSIKPADDLYIDDPTLPSGTIRQIEHKAWGARVIFNYKVTRGDEVLTDYKFTSNYQPWQAVYLRGTGQ